MLRNLRLDGKLEKLSEWIPKLQNLVKLTMVLMYSKLTGDVMKLLKSMPNLLYLYVSNCDYGDKFKLLHFQDGWFKNLKELHLHNFDNLSYILIDEGALHSLKKFQLSSIPQLKTLPTGIHRLQKLEFLCISSMCVEFMESIAPDEGEEHWIFKQVPFVEISGGSGPIKHTLSNFERKKRYVFAFVHYPISSDAVPNTVKLRS
jgi:disease resistance protein RPM1